MSYKKLDNGNINDEPRKFQKEAYEYILHNFPQIYAATDEARNITRDCILTKVISEMNKYKLAPSMLEKFYKTLFGYHLRSIIVPGTDIGTLAGEALGATTTQSTLNTFHTAGSSKSASSGIDAIKELVYTKAERKNESCQIYFLNRYFSLREINELRADIIGSYVSDFVSRYEILRRPNLDNEYYYEEQIAELKFWTRHVNRISGMDIPQNSKYILRLFLNQNELYKQKVTIKDINDALLRDVNTVIVPVYGTMDDAIIDIYATDEINPNNLKKKGFSHYSGMSQDEYEPLFLQNGIYDNLNTVIVKGIKGIRNASAFEINILSAVCNYRLVTLDDLPDYLNYKSKKYSKEEYLNHFEELWILFFNRYVTREHGIKTSHIADIFESAKFEPLLEDKNGNWLIVNGGKPKYNINSEMKLSKRISILDKINEYIDKEIRKCELILTKIQKEEKLQYGKIISDYIYPNDFLRKTKLYILETEGCNLEDIYKHPGVDTSLTSSNNMFQVNSMLGIEAAYAMYTKELSDTIRNNKSYVNPIHILMIAEFVMNRGYPRGTNFSGVYRQAAGPLELATIERAGKVISEAGEFGKYESIKGVSASIIVNSRIQIGTGANSVGQDIIVNDEVIDTLINEDIYTIHDIKTKITDDIIEKEIDDIRDYEVDVKVDLTLDDDDDTIIPEIGVGNDVYELDTNIKSKSEVWSKNKINKSQYKSIKNSKSIVYNCIKELKCKINYFISEIPHLDFLREIYEYKGETNTVNLPNIKQNNIETEKYEKESLNNESESGMNQFLENFGKYL